MNKHSVAIYLRDGLLQQRQQRICVSCIRPFVYSCRRLSDFGRHKLVLSSLSPVNLGFYVTFRPLVLDAIVILSGNLPKKYCGNNQFSTKKKSNVKTYYM